jgi:hypothetical protein
MGQTTSTPSSGQTEPVITRDESSASASTQNPSIPSDNQESKSQSVGNIVPDGVMGPTGTGDENKMNLQPGIPEQSQSIVTHNLDTWFKDLLNKLGSTPSEMYVISSDVVLSTAFDFATAKAYAQQEAKKSLAKGLYRYKFELHTKSETLKYLITVYERNPNLIFGQSVTVAQFNVWKVPICRALTRPTTPA